MPLALRVNTVVTSDQETYLNMYHQYRILFLVVTLLVEGRFLQFATFCFNFDSEQLL